jgi:type II secretory pathway pseudopilin PulG
MIELLATIAIIAVIALIAFTFVGNYVDYARLTAARRSVAILNESLNEYRTLGGIAKAHSLEGTAGTTINAATLTSSVMDAMRNGFTVGGHLKNFINKTQKFDTSLIASTGQGTRFRFVVNSGSGSVETPTEPGSGDEPTITTQPEDYAGTEDDSVTLSVIGSSADELSYQWYYDGVAIDGAQESDYTFTLTDTTAGDYYVTLSNASGTVTSRTATTSIVVSVFATGLDASYLTQGTGGNLYAAGYGVYKIDNGGTVSQIANIEDCDHIFFNGTGLGVVAGFESYSFYNLTTSGAGVSSVTADRIWGAAPSFQSSYYLSVLNGSTYGIYEVNTSGTVDGSVDVDFRPEEVACGGDGTLYVIGQNTETDAQAVYAVSIDDSTVSLLASIPSVTTGRLAVDTSSVYVIGFADDSEGYDSTVYKVNVNGIRSVLASGLESLSSITLGNDGYLYAVSAYGSSIYRIGTSGGSTKVVAHLPLSEAPAGDLVQGDDGDLYVIKNMNIYRVSL